MRDIQLSKIRKELLSSRTFTNQLYISQVQTELDLWFRVFNGVSKLGKVTPKITYGW
ncbi:Uncharacterised protein [Enterobacter cancerogenus]|uniref:Uncharacterized protein n=1 Tax=Enterobacter cancerogenus TaxID=69218 RepID=A0A484Z6C1_9ENTR|nr:Uncharacterised protein [Enterobacter cancerogenus]